MEDIKQRELENLFYIASQEEFDELHYDPLYTFSSLREFERVISYINPFIILKFKISKWGKGYVLLKDKKKYYFESITSKGLNKVDIKNIHKGFNSLNELIFMCLRVTAHRYLNNAHFIFGKMEDKFKSLVSYSKNGKEYVIDYDLDIIMEKDKYYELYNIKEITKLNQNDVYNIWLLYTELDRQIDPIFLAIFYPEIMKKYWFDDKSKYDKMGMHKNNYCLVGDDCDCVFRILNKIPLSEDFKTISTFTLAPSKEVKGMINLQNGAYKYKGYKFQLLSDDVIDEEIKKELLSKERYGYCHTNSSCIMYSLNQNNPIPNLYIVSGYLYYGEKDSFLHTWVEIEYKDATIIIDYSNNLIMLKKAYYKLLGVEQTSKITCEDYELLERRFDELELPKNDRVLAYFGNELLANLNHNKFLFKR